LGGTAANCNCGVFSGGTSMTILVEMPPGLLLL
jgi:hypothetical protein